MIRAFYGLTETPFTRRDVDLLPHQREIYDILNVHCQQGGLCLVLGNPGTGKTVIKDALKQLPQSRHLVATIARTLHTYTNTIKILCEAFGVEFDHSAFNRDREEPHGSFPPTPPGIRVRTTAVRLVKLWVQVLGEGEVPAPSSALERAPCSEPGCG